MRPCHHHSNKVVKTDKWDCTWVRMFGDTKKTWQCHHSVVCSDCGRIITFGISALQCPEYTAAHTG